MASAAEGPLLKRAREDELGSSNKRAAAEDEESSSDDDVGPSLPSAVAPKKRRTLRHESLYLSNLPTQQKYYRSLMHRDTVSFVRWTPNTDFLITTSDEGVVKFWKKASVGLEFVKTFKAHEGVIVDVSVSADGRSFASVGVDKTIKIFDVVTFDLMAIINIQYTPTCVCWVHKKGASIPLLALADEIKQVLIYDGRGEKQEPIHTLPNLHRAVVALMEYNTVYDCVVSADVSGIVEYWQPSGDYEKPREVFEYKSSTNLFDFKKAKSAPTSLTISPSGKQFTTISYPDRQIRVFDFPTAKLLRTYDESAATLTGMQQAGTALLKLDDVDFGRKLVAESSLPTKFQNVVFDESENFIIYASMLGIKVVNMVTNRVSRLLGSDEPGMGRALNIALYQGAPLKKGLVTMSMAASANPLLQESELRDPMLVVTAFQKPRFYMFNTDEEVTKSERDVYNEKPFANANPTAVVAEKPKETGSSAIIHTTMGDVQIRLFPEAAPKAVENFVTHAKNGYYNNIIFHRCMPKFMIQTGDPLGDGTGGESIWRREFEDEFSTLRHDKPYTVSMANAGANTNGSQFFITVEKTSWLDGKHTIFGRAVGGLDVAMRISQVRTVKDKPVVDVKIVSITVL